jgi:hypothetical protein
VCGLHHAQGDEEREFLGLASKQRSTVSPGLASKLVGTVSWFGPENQVGYGLSVAPQNRQEDEDGMGHTSRYSSLLRLEASWVRIFYSSLKTSGGTTRMVHVASLQRSLGMALGRVEQLPTHQQRGYR